MSKRDRKRRPARRKAFREPKPRILVVMEGSVTENDYLEGLAAACKNSRVEVQLSSGAGVPMSVVSIAKQSHEAANKQAKRESDDNLRFDQVWCVFDVDDHPHVAEARGMARDNRFQLAVSNPCIELWLWLHFADQPGMQHRHDLQKMLRDNYLPNYDKHVDFAKNFAAGYESAVRRAERLETTAIADGDEGRNPTTGVWRLTEEIRKQA